MKPKGYTLPMPKLAQKKKGMKTAPEALAQMAERRAMARAKARRAAK